jgi:hypothetical protein
MPINRTIAINPPVFENKVSRIIENKNHPITSINQIWLRCRLK